MASAMSCAYGSTLSPSRLSQLRATTAEYMSLATPESDSWFQFWLPHIIRQQGFAMAASDSGAAQYVWDLLADAPILWCKSAEVNIGKYFLILARTEEDVKLHAVKACLYGFACFQLGHKKVSQSDATSSLSSKATPGGSSSSTAAPAPEPAEGATLKQLQGITTEKTWRGENQLHTAALVYADFNVLYKQCIIKNVAGATEAWGRDQNHRLRERMPQSSGSWR